MNLTFLGMILFIAAVLIAFALHAGFGWSWPVSIAAAVLLVAIFFLTWTMWRIKEFGQD